METFFPDDSHLRYWLCNASVSHIACRVSWPPIVAAIGYAPCVRAWAPTSRDEPEFKPVHQLLEVDGERFVAVTIKGDLLVAADASSSGRISIWDTSTWTRQQTLTAGAPVTAMDASRTFIAAGTAAGYVRVWRRQSATDATFTQFFAPDLQLDTLPVYCVKLGPLRQPGGSGTGGGGGADSGGSDAVMVVHTRGNGRVSAWRLSDAKIIGTLGRSGPTDCPEALLSANVLHACLAKDVLLTCSWMEGKDPLLQWIHPVQRAGGEVPGISQHLAGLARPLCCDYDGTVIVMGCEDGMVWVWGLLQGQAQGPVQQQQQQQPLQDVSHWRGYHRGAVGAVACLPNRSQIASAGADGNVKLWSMSGSLLALARLGWQPTALAVNELALVVGGAAGQIQMVLLLTEEHAAASRPTEAELREAQTPPTSAAASTVHESVAVQYGYWFDARSPRAAAGGSGGSSSCGGSDSVGIVGTTGPWGRVSELPDAFAAFVPPRRQVTMADLQQHQHQQQRGPTSHSTADSSGTAGSQGAGGSAATGAAADVAIGAGSNGSSCSSSSIGDKASSFNMQAALKGAQRSATDQAAAEEEAKRAQLRAMGEGPGVARSQGPVQLDSATAATMGRKCANPSCMQREGLLALQQQSGGRGATAACGGGAFKRCGACKSAFYCSTHCQSTHWRDGHKKECPLLSAAWRRQQQELLEQEQDEQQQQQQQQQRLKPQEQQLPSLPQQQQQQQQETQEQCKVATTHTASKIIATTKILNGGLMGGNDDSDGGDGGGKPGHDSSDDSCQYQQQHDKSVLGLHALGYGPQSDGGKAMETTAGQAAAAAAAAGGGGGGGRVQCLPIGTATTASNTITTTPVHTGSILGNPKEATTALAPTTATATSRNEEAAKSTAATVAADAATHKDVDIQCPGAAQTGLPGVLSEIRWGSSDRLNELD